MSTQLHEALKSVKLGVGLDRLANLHDSRALDREAAANNAKKQVGWLTTDRGFMVKVRDFMSFRGFYDISNGSVDFFRESPGGDKEPGSASGRQPLRGIASRFLQTAGDAKDGQYVNE